MRTLRRITPALLLALGLSTAAFAQSTPSAVSLNATVGPSFGNVGTTISTIGDIGVKLTDRISLIGEGGMLARAPFNEAGTVAAPAPPIDGVDKVRVNAYHWNGNLKVHPFAMGPVAPYVTAGAGSFAADTVTPSRQVAGVWIQDRRRVTDFATNVGAGVTYRMNKWLGVGADYRTFFVHRDADTPKVNRFTAGLTFSLN